jgi:putative alpha-1,2-mannosidase
MIKFKIITPKNRDGGFHEPFDPLSGANFEENIGFIEGNAWQYALWFHDINGLMQLMGGKKNLQINCKSF